MQLQILVYRLRKVLCGNKFPYDSWCNKNWWNTIWQQVAAKPLLLGLEHRLDYTVDKMFMSCKNNLLSCSADRIKLPLKAILFLDLLFLLKYWLGRVIQMTSRMGSLSKMSKRYRQQIRSPDLTTVELSAIMDQFVHDATSPSYSSLDWPKEDSYGCCEPTWVLLEWLMSLFSAVGTLFC